MTYERLGRMKKFVWLSLVVIGLAIVFVVGRSGERSPPATAQPAEPVVATSVATAENPANLSASSSPDSANPALELNRELPPSLDGTEIDGAIELDANGQLKPTHSLRRLFDQVLTLMGERSIDEIRALLAQREVGFDGHDVARDVLETFALADRPLFPPAREGCREKTQNALLATQHGFLPCAFEAAPE